MAAEPAFDDVVGLRELRQHASDIVRRVEEGGKVTVTVNGRPAARLVPVGRSTWRHWDDLRGLFADDRAAEGWAGDRDALDQQAHDPWAAR